MPAPAEVEVAPKESPSTTSAPARTGEYAGLSSEQIKDLRRHKLAMEISADYCRPYFDKFIRLLKLYRGVLPEEIDCTFSKVMLWIPFSIVQNELPRSAAMMFSQEDFFSLFAEDLTLETSADAAQKWLNHTMRKQNRIYPRIKPTLTRVNVFGTGYRIVTHNVMNKSYESREPSGYIDGIPYGFKTQKRIEERFGIVSQNADIFSVLPSPNGGMANALDNEIETCAEWVNWVDYMSEDKLKRLARTGVFDRTQVGRLLGCPVTDQEGPDAIDVTYKRTAAASINDGVATDQGMPGWVQRIRDNNEGTGLKRRYRCVWSWFRDRWMCIGEGRFPIYAGPPGLDWFPIAKYVDTPDFDDWFGVGLLETCEDIILAYLLNYNFRLDYLATTLHPTKFVREDLVAGNGGNIADFDPAPYGMFKFPRKIQRIQDAIWYDRFPEISPQAFMEETGFRQLLQEITSQPNYMKGMGGAGTLANETATGIVSLIEEGTARSTMRSIDLEYIGLHDELMLALKWGKKYVWEDQTVRVQSDDGWPWTKIPHDAIDDGYGIELMGTRQLVHKNEAVKRLLAILPMLVNNPSIPNQKELFRQTLRNFGVFRNPEELLNAPPGQVPAMLAPPATPGATAQPQMNPQAGMGGQSTMQNESTSTMNRTGPPKQKPTTVSFAV